MEIVEEASHFGFRLEEPEVQTGSQVPLRSPREMLLELFWVKSLSVVVEETKGRLGGLNEENLKRCLGMFAWLSIIKLYRLTTETASFESFSTLRDLKAILS